MSQNRRLLFYFALLVVGLMIGCSRGATPSPRHQSSDAADGGGSSVADSAAASDAGSPTRPRDDASVDGGDSLESAQVGILGRVEVLEGSSARGVVVIARPDHEEPVGSAAIGPDGGFKIRNLTPGTYRLILPADGIHSTADMYVTMEPDAGPAEVIVPRAKGCPVKIVVRDHDDEVISGAELSLSLTDLPQVRERHVSQSVSNTKGQIRVIGSCVRGYFEGKLVVPDRGSFDVRHGYVGTGWDQFDIVLPEGADAGVSYANDD